MQDSLLKTLGMRPMCVLFNFVSLLVANLLMNCDRMHISRYV